MLILTTSHGASHRRASLALQKAVSEAAPDAAVEVVDAIRRCARWFRAYYDSYEIPLRYWPSLWRRIEDYQHQQPSTGPGWLYRLGARPLFGYFQNFDPDVVVATEVGVCELAAMCKREARASFYLAALELMDFNRAWVQSEVDLYSVVHRDLGTELILAGAPASKVVVTGMPIDPAYAHLPDRSTVQARLGVRTDLPLLLVLFGGTGHGNPDQITTELKRVRAPFQTVFIAGRNKRLEKQLRGFCARQPDWRALGWVTNMHEWMKAADLLLTKPGGGTVMEAAACGLPLLAFDPLPGNEERTCAWLEKWRAGIWLRSPADVSSTIERLLSHRGELVQLAERSRSLSRPHAAAELARMLLASGLKSRQLGA
ncbi:MAG TPA: glycosyltransferase [Terriglobia bacterium]|nr:glycosyltransferase [Terriglobia bacterium]